MIDDLKEINEREISSLISHGLKLPKEPERIVVTWDYEDERRMSWYGRTADVKFIPIYKYLGERNASCGYNEPSVSD